MSFDEFVDYAHKVGREYRDWRFGQCVFNALVSVKPELANEIRGTVFDPFFDEEGSLALTDCLRHIEEKWEPKP